MSKRKLNTAEFAALEILKSNPGLTCYPLADALLARGISYAKGDTTPQHAASTMLSHLYGEGKVDRCQVRCPAAGRVMYAYSIRGKKKARPDDEAQMELAIEPTLAEGIKAAIVKLDQDMPLSAVEPIWARSIPRGVIAERDADEGRDAITVNIPLGGDRWERIGVMAAVNLKAHLDIVLAR